MHGPSSYFDLLAGLAERRVAGPNIPERPPVLPQYLALAAGVTAEPFARQVIENRTIDFGSALGIELLLGLIIALVIFPGAYRNAFDPERPILAQLAVIFAYGTGWQLLFQAAAG